MTRHGPLALVMMLCLSFAKNATALADAYPYEGYFTIAFDPNTPSRRDVAKCAFNFFRQNTDGSFISYHLDDADFAKTGRIRYVRYNNGQCTFGPAPNLESCLVTFDPNKNDQGVTHYDILQGIEPGVVKVLYLGTSKELTSSAAALSAQGTPLVYQRCRFAPDPIGQALSDETSSLSNDERDKLLFPADARLDGEDAVKIARQLGLYLPPQ